MSDHFESVPMTIEDLISLETEGERVEAKGHHHLPLHPVEEQDHPPLAAVTPSFSLDSDSERSLSVLLEGEPAGGATDTRYQKYYFSPPT